jgi:hypothetical protein
VTVHTAIQGGEQQVRNFCVTNGDYAGSTHARPDLHRTHRSIAGVQSRILARYACGSVRPRSQLRWSGRRRCRRRIFFAHIRGHARRELPVRRVFGEHTGGRTRELCRAARR